MTSSDVTPLVRTYGAPPYAVAVVHGGPGAAGDMAPVAARLAHGRGVLEPIQTQATIDGQVQELREALEARATTPAVLIGHSWGAWLSLLVATRFPGLVGKLILVGTPAFEERYAAVLLDNRLRPLLPAEREEFLELARWLGKPGAEQAAAPARLADLSDRSDVYEALAGETPGPIAGVSERAAEIYAGVWPAAARMRSEGRWLPLLDQVACPVVALHGATDSTPVESVAVPLSRAVSNFRLVVLQRCGHTPWRERWAAEPFYAAIERELNAIDAPGVT